MVISNENKSLINGLQELNGHSCTHFLREFLTKNLTKVGLDYMLAKIDSRGSVNHVERGGCPCTACIVKNITIVEDMVGY